MEHWLGDHFEYFPQHGNALGDKMYNAIVEMLKQKYKKVVLVGSDIPTLDSTTIVRAFTSLDDYDLALCPSKDRGYYLIGMKKQYPTLFQDMAWSTNVVLQQTIQKARQAQLDIVQLEVKSDIDSYDEVVELWNYLKKRNMYGVYPFKSKTHQVLKKLFDTEYAFTQQ